MKTIIFVLILTISVSFLHTEETKRSSTDVVVSGNIHFYGDRYILKGSDNDYGKWFVLLESPSLEKIAKNVDLFSLYKIEGKIYLFNNTMYLLPSKLEAIEKTTTSTATLETKKKKKTSSKKKKKSTKKKKKPSKKRKKSTKKKRKSSKKKKKSTKKKKKSSKKKKKSTKKKKKSSKKKKKSTRKKRSENEDEIED